MMPASSSDLKSTALLSDYSGDIATNADLDKAHKAIIQQGHDQINIVMARMKEFFDEMIQMKAELDREITSLNAVKSYGLLTWITSETDCRKQIVAIAERMNNACMQRAKTYPTIEKQQADVAQLIAKIEGIRSTNPGIVNQCRLIIADLKATLTEVVTAEQRAKDKLSKINFKELSGILLRYGHESVPKDPSKKADLARASEIIALSATIADTVMARFKPAPVILAAAKK